MITSHTHNQMSLRTLVNKMSLLVADHDLTTPYRWIQVIKGHASILFLYLIIQQTRIDDLKVSGSSCYGIRSQVIIKPVPCHDRINEDKSLDGGIAFSVTIHTVIVLVSDVILIIRGLGQDALKHKQRKSCQTFFQ